MTTETIRVYTTNSCAYCSLIKRYLDSKGKTYEVVNLDEHPERQAEALAISGALTVPITVIGEQVVIGWNLSKLAPLVAGLPPANKTDTITKGL